LLAFLLDGSIADVLVALAGDVLEELLDEIDVSEDHATAAVTLETDRVESITRKVGVLAGLVPSQKSCRFRAQVVAHKCHMKNLPFLDFLGEKLHVFLPQIADDLCDC
jgi:hypothetical protein